MSPAHSALNSSGLQQHPAFGASRPDLANLQQLSRTTSPVRHPGVTHPLKATTLSGTGNKVGLGPCTKLRLRQSLPPPLGWCTFTQNVGLNSLKIKHSPQRENLTGVSITINTADQETESVSSTCILKAVTPVFWCSVLI